MQPIEIIVIIAASLTVVSVIVSQIIKRKKGKTSCGCDCANCKSNCARLRRENNQDND